jgi:hypothetical protein
MIEVGGMQLQVPPGWGDLEPDPAGGLVIHSRPRRCRVDGDAVWYATAIELRIRPTGSPLPRSMEAMTICRKMIGNSSTGMLIELAIANGVSLAQRRIAQRVFDSTILRSSEKSEPMLMKEGHSRPVVGMHGAANDGSMKTRRKS